MKGTKIIYSDDEAVLFECGVCLWGYDSRYDLDIHRSIDHIIEPWIR